LVEETEQPEVPVDLVDPDVPSEPETVEEIDETAGPEDIDQPDTELEAQPVEIDQEEIDCTDQDYVPHKDCTKVISLLY